jgi:hypothetical protein
VTARLPASKAAPILALGLGLEAIFVLAALARRGPDPLVPTVALHFAASLLYLVAIGVAFRGTTRGAYRAILVFSVLFRVTLVAAPVTLSTDVWRYVWEGSVIRAGENPYAHAPSAPELAPLRTEAWERVEHKEVPAAYGPLAELAFAPVAFLPERLRTYALKAIFALADLGVLLLVTRFLERRGLPAALALVQGWHPLAVLEVAGEGHLDAAGVLLMLLALDAIETGKARRAGVALGLAAAVKYLPFVLFPALLRRSGPRAAGLAVVSAVAPALAFVAAGPTVARGLARYAEIWRFNATGFLVLEQLLGDGLAPRVAAGLIVLAVAIVLGLRVRAELAAFATIGCVLALSPVLHPWYLLWILPFLAWRLSGALLELTLAVPVVYAILAGYDGTHASWVEAAWPRLLWIGPFIFLIALGAVLRRRAPG